MEQVVDRRLVHVQQLGEALNAMARRMVPVRVRPSWARRVVHLGELLPAGDAVGRLELLADALELVAQGVEQAARRAGCCQRR
ncbi:MAG: hypothetical protein U5O39_17765 [Gammaproteobacteria bacterium]|nr:hypothetical protein [Gammaproteobacteria bacterium]